MLQRSPSSRACALARSFQGHNKMTLAIQRNYNPWSSSTEAIHSCHGLISSTWSHLQMRVAEKRCFMWLWVGFPKSFIDLFHIRPAVHYHLGWDNPCCCLCSPYSPSDLFWLYSHLGPIYNLARNPKMTPWVDTKIIVVLSTSVMPVIMPFFQFLFLILTDHKGQVGKL